MTIAPESAFTSVARPASSGPPVDIGMPAYRRPHFIGEAIESVLAQTYTNWRLVVSENGPGGGEVEAAVRQYTSDPRVRYVTTGRNIGPAANWTRVLQAGTAPYFTMLQDDDKWDPDFLARRVEFLESHPSCGFVYSGERWIDQNGREIDEGTDIAEILEEGVYSPREYIQSLYRHKLGGINTPSICTLGVMSRRSALETVGAEFGAAYPFLCFDVGLYLRLALRFPTGFMAVRDASVRIHHPRITTENSLDGEYFVRYQEYHADWFRRELPGLRLPREHDEILADACIKAALDVLERGDRRGCSRYLRNAVGHSPAAIVNPRVAAAASGLVLGRLGVGLLARARAARRASQNC